MNIIAEELQRRFGDQAKIHYHDVRALKTTHEHGDAVTAITEQGLMYPVTFIDGAPVNDRMISFPLIMRTVQTRLAEADASVKD